MSYMRESQALIDETIAKLNELMAPYEHMENPGLLDGGPWDAEERRIKEKFTKELKALREKYPNWKNELENDRK